VRGSFDVKAEADNLLERQRHLTALSFQPEPEAPEAAEWRNLP